MEWRMGSWLAAMEQTPAKSSCPTGCSDPPVQRFWHKEVDPSRSWWLGMDLHWYVFGESVWPPSPSGLVISLVFGVSRFGEVGHWRTSMPNRWAGSATRVHQGGVGSEDEDWKGLAWRIWALKRWSWWMGTRLCSSNRWHYGKGQKRLESRELVV